MHSLLPTEQTRLASLHPLAQHAFSLLQQAWQSGTQDYVLVSALRTWDEQAACYAQGRTTPGPIVTHAKPGCSWHNYGMCFDLAACHGIPGRSNGVIIDWSIRMDPLGKLAASCGLAWGGTWNTPDENHFQVNHPDIDLKLLQAAYPHGWQPGITDPEAWRDLV